MKTRVTPIVTFSNTAEDILGYLAKRTADTVGKQVDRADVIIVGHAKKYEARSVPVRSEHVVRLKPWLSGDTGSDPTIFVQVTTVQVETWLVGPADTTELDIAYVYPSKLAPGGADFVPIFYAEDRGLLFLKKVPRDVPYAPYIPDPAYQLADGETGVRNFLVTDYDNRGQPVIRDETAKIEETITAVQWYASLPREKPGTLHKALLQALDSPNPQVSRHAIRALAHRRGPNTAGALKEELPEAGQDLRVRLMLGLWLVGEREAAGNLLEELFQAEGKYAWLDAWGIKPTLVKKGEPIETLYGPDPCEAKGE
jgi:hypothetical protein